MDSEEDSSRAIAHNLMADLLDIPHNFAPPPFELALEGWEDSPTGPLGTTPKETKAVSVFVPEDSARSACDWKLRHPICISSEGD